MLEKNAEYQLHHSTHLITCGIRVGKIPAKKQPDKNCFMTTRPQALCLTFCLTPMNALAYSVVCKQNIGTLVLYMHT